MKANQTAPKTIDEYIAAFSRDVRETLQKIRTTIKKAAPGAEEAIKYQMPASVLHGNLVFFAAFKQHIGFYATSTGNGTLKAELAVYAGPKGSLKFPLDQPVPLGLISKVVKFRVMENLAEARATGKKR